MDNDKNAIKISLSLTSQQEAEEGHDERVPKVNESTCKSFHLKSSDIVVDAVKKEVECCRTTGQKRPPPPMVILKTS